MLQGKQIYILAKNRTMKKLLLIISGLALTGIVKAQSSFQVTELQGGAAAQNSYIFNTDTNNLSSPSELLEFKIKNTSVSSKLIKIRKVIQSMATNTVTAFNHDMYFCYNITCYTPSTFYSYANIAAGAALPSGSGTSYGLRTEFDHNKVVGTSVVKYTIYDSTNTNDAFNITITYNISGVAGIKNINSNVNVSNVAPNPASNLITFTYDMGNANTDAYIKIYNCLGNVVKSISLNPAEKNVQADVSTLEEGFYFYSIITNGKAVSTRRLVIAR